MIRKVLLASVALCSASAAFAADLPSRIAAPAPAPLAYAAPVFTWTGFYVGVNAGAAWTGKDSCPVMGSTTSGAFVADTTYTPNCDRSSNTNFIGGGQAGFNWQTGALVFGIEGDVDWMGRGGRGGYDYSQTGAPTVAAATVTSDPVTGAPTASSTTTTVNNTTYTYHAGRNGDMLSTVRGRLGFAVDRALFFVTGGAAFRGSSNGGSISTSTTTYTSTVTTDLATGTSTQTGSTGPIPGATTTYTRSGSNHNIGWVLGGGLEYALSPNVSAKLEYIHAQFDKDNGLYTSAGTTTAFSGGKGDNSVDAVRVGLNWRFGAGPAPVAVSPVSARY